MTGQSSENGSYRWVILGAVFLLLGVDSMATYSYGPLAPFLRDAFGLSRAQVGLFNTLNYLALVLFGAPAGWLIDRFGIRRLLLIGPGMYGLFFALWAQAPNVLLAYILVFIAGLGYVFVATTTTLAVVAWFPPRSRATAISIKQSALTLGSAITAVMVPSLSLLLGWRTTVAIVGMAGVAAAVLSSALYRQKPGDRPVTARPPALAALRQTLANRGLLILGFVGAVYVGLQISIASYLVLQLVEVRQLAVVAAGTFLMVTNLAGAFGRVGWGAISDRVFRGERGIVLIIIGITSGVMALVLSSASAAMPLWLLYLAVAVFGATGFGWNGVYLTFATEIAGKETAATSFGWVVAISSTGGMVGPPIFGYIVDQTSSYAPAWLAFGILTIIAALSIRLIRTPASGKSPQSYAP